MSGSRGTEGARRYDWRAFIHNMSPEQEREVRRLIGMSGSSGKCQPLIRITAAMREAWEARRRGSRAVWSPPLSQVDMYDDRTIPTQPEAGIWAHHQCSLCGKVKCNPVSSVFPIVRRKEKEKKNRYPAERATCGVGRQDDTEKPNDDDVGHQRGGRGWRKDDVGWHDQNIVGRWEVAALQARAALYAAPVFAQPPPPQPSPSAPQPSPPPPHPLLAHASPACGAPAAPPTGTVWLTGQVVKGLGGAGARLYWAPLAEKGASHELGRCGVRSAENGTHRGQIYLQVHECVQRGGGGHSGAGGGKRQRGLRLRNSSEGEVGKRQLLAYRTGPPSAGHLGRIRGWRGEERASDNVGPPIALTCPFWVEGAFARSSYPFLSSMVPNFSKVQLPEDDVLPDNRTAGHNPRFWCLPPMRNDVNLEVPRAQYRFYLVTRGRMVGVWRRWSVAQLMTTGFPDAGYKGHNSYKTCIAEWQEQCRMGVHPHPVDPDVINAQGKRCEVVGETSSLVVAAKPSTATSRRSGGRGTAPRCSLSTPPSNVSAVVGRDAPKERAPRYFAIWGGEIVYSTSRDKNGKVPRFGELPEADRRSVGTGVEERVVRGVD
ncbi:hypothetical protein C8R43DRAFT_962546 [Mycena crocata]|nr:hypothetical protein C8R43DRAFT_962546 [Mycena crocata]